MRPFEPLKHKRIKQGVENMIHIHLHKEYVSKMGVVTHIPINLDGWKFKMYVHRHVEYCVEQLLFKTVGYVPNPEDGTVYFITTACKNDLDPGMYWYTVEYETPDGKVHKTHSAKYEIVKSFNPYFSIYK